MSFLFLVSVVLFPVRSTGVFFSCNRIISHDRIYVERMFWGPHDRFSSPTAKKIAKTIIIICPFRQILSCSNLPTSSVELIWLITELYFRQILSTDLMNRFCQDVKTGPKIRPKHPADSQGQK